MTGSNMVLVMLCYNILCTGLYRNIIIQCKTMQEKYFRVGNFMLPGGLQTLMYEFVKKK